MLYERVELTTRGLCVRLQEETHTLLREMEVLQERLRNLEEQRWSAKGSLAVSQRDNELLRESVRSQQFSLAASQCVVSGLLVRNGQADLRLIVIVCHECSCVYIAFM